MGRRCTGTGVRELVCVDYGYGYRGGDRPRDDCMERGAAPWARSILEASTRRERVGVKIARRRYVMESFTYIIRKACRPIDESPKMDVPSLFEVVTYGLRNAMGALDTPDIASALVVCVARVSTKGKKRSRREGMRPARVRAV